jgi:uncharacterized short protein YbdD (DUF466 family)
MRNAMSNLMPSRSHTAHARLWDDASESQASTQPACLHSGCSAANVSALATVSIPALGFAQALHQFNVDRESAGVPGAALKLCARLLHAGWQALRQVSGDDAYERYIAHMTQQHPGQPPMGRTDYYKFCQEQKWNRVTRCC